MNTTVSEMYSETWVGQRDKDECFSIARRDGMRDGADLMEEMVRDVEGGLMLRQVMSTAD